MTIANAIDLPAVNDGVGVLEIQLVPLDVKMLPLELGATKVGEDVPLPIITLFAVRVDKPVPPYVGVIAVPCQTPEPIVPTVVSDEVTTVLPRTVLDNTFAPLI